MKQNIILMKKIKLVLTFLITLSFCFTVFGQTKVEKPIKQQEINNVVSSIAKLIEQHYVSLEIGKKISDLIITKNKNGAYRNITDAHKFANQLTSDLRSFNGDLHLKVNILSANNSSVNKNVPQQVDYKGIWSNYGFQDIKILDGNIGYIKINHFTKWNHFKEAKKVITATFNTLQNTDALIVDVRNNGGGFEAIVAYFISYLFEGDPIHLSDYYIRFNDKKTSIWTTSDIPGKKLPNIPVYVLVNNRSTSAAESLAYMLKHQKRATVIGEITAGAGHGALTHKVFNQFSVSISSAETINAVTKTSFEKVGVIPDIKVTSDEAFSKAYILALNYLKNNNTRGFYASNYESVINFLPSSVDEKEINKADYEKYVGIYKSQGIELVISVNETGLYAQMIGRKGKMKLIPRDNHIFIVDDLKERIQFVFDSKNEAIKLIGIDTPMELEKVKKH